MVAGVACASADHYVYSARKYDADVGCLEPYRAVDLVAGDSVSSKCDPVCFRYGNDTFTSKVCPPLPDLAVGLDAESPECKAANALYDQTCGADAAAGDADDDDSTDRLDAGDGGD